ncbi:MAG: YgfZ/GcvT domain-containing protein [Steroidobacteraceae bacterium]
MTAMILTYLGVIAARGPDTRRFLNGQLSQDLTALSAGQAVRAGLHNPQGRVLALLLILPQGSDDLLLLLPHERIPSTLALLQRYVLRSKVKLTDESALWRIEGGGPESPADDTPLAAPYASDGRWIRLQPSDTADVTDADDLAAWQLADVRAGLPLISEATAGEFVAQMLNLDLLGAISFTKGCYTGQEVIARAHYRGRVKRRLQRFDASMVASGELAPAASITLQDGRSAQVVQIATTDAGITEFLAVTTFDLPSLPLGYELPKE